MLRGLIMSKQKFLFTTKANSNRSAVMTHTHDSIVKFSSIVVHLNKWCHFLKFISQFIPFINQFETQFPGSSIDIYVYREINRRKLSLFFLYSMTRIVHVQCFIFFVFLPSLSFLNIFWTFFSKLYGMGSVI